MRPIIDEIVFLDENGEGCVKYPPMEFCSIVTDHPLIIRCGSGQIKSLDGQMCVECRISYMSLYDGELGE